MAEMYLPYEVYEKYKTYTTSPNNVASIPTLSSRHVPEEAYEDSGRILWRREHMVQDKQDHA